MSNTIEQAAIECRAAWASHPDAEYGWCVHHGREIEKLTEPVENRIRYILDNKNKIEQIIRLDNLRPVISRQAIIAWEAFGEAYVLARKAYSKATGPARKAHDKIIALALKAYDEATGPAQMAYDKIIALAWKAYNEATGPAQKAYNEATTSAVKACNEAIALAHKRDVPNHSWNGKSIFAKE